MKIEHTAETIRKYTGQGSQQTRVFMRVLAGLFVVVWLMVVAHESGRSNGPFFLPPIMIIMFLLVWEMNFEYSEWAILLEVTQKMLTLRGQGGRIIEIPITNIAYFTLVPKGLPVQMSGALLLLRSTKKVFGVISVRSRFTLPYEKGYCWADILSEAGIERRF